MTGYADGPPVEMRHVMDHSAGMHAAVATMAALHQRRRTGGPQHIDLAAREVASAMIGDALIQASLGLTPGTAGKRAPVHGAARRVSHAEARSLVDARSAQRCRVAGADPRIGSIRRVGRSALCHCRSPTAASRRARCAARAMARATAMPMPLRSACSSAGVCAHVSWSMQDIAGDPHLRARGATTEVQRSRHSAAAWRSARPARFSKTQRGRYPPADAGARPGRGLCIRRTLGPELGPARRPRRRARSSMLEQPHT